MFSIYDAMSEMVNPSRGHVYHLFSTGTTLKSRDYKTRRDAEIAMNTYCAKNGIEVECTECDKHERKYSNHNGICFYINRV